MFLVMLAIQYGVMTALFAIPYKRLRTAEAAEEAPAAAEPA